MLKREYFTEPENDLTLIYRDDPQAYMINQILSHCVVERKANCYASADLLLAHVDARLRVPHPTLSCRRPRVGVPDLRPSITL